MKALRPLTASLMLLTSCLLISNTTLAKGNGANLLI